MCLSVVGKSNVTIPGLSGCAERFVTNLYASGGDVITLPSNPPSNALFVRR